MAIYPYQNGGSVGRPMGTSIGQFGQPQSYAPKIGQSAFAPPPQMPAPQPAPTAAPAPAPTPAPPKPPSTPPTTAPAPPPTASPTPPPAPPPPEMAPPPTLQPDLGPAMGPALQALGAPIEMAEGWGQQTLSSVTRPGLGQRQLPQAQQVFMGGQVY